MSTAGESRRAVVDASVAVKWHLPDELHAQHAQALLADYRDGRVELLAPDHIRHEVANAINVAVLTNRLSPAQGATAIDEFLAWQIQFVRDDDLVVLGYGYAQRYGCAYYDALYLALADRTACPFVRADRR